MLPPQKCCLLYWMLTCQGQASTGAFSPPTTRGAFRLSPQAGLGSKERESRSQAFGGWSCLSLELKSIPSRLLCLVPGVVVVKRTRPIVNDSWGDIEFPRPQTFPGLSFLFILFFPVWDMLRSLYCEHECVHYAVNLWPLNQTMMQNQNYESLTQVDCPKATPTE